MPNSSFKYHLIADLLNSLKAEGYAIGTGLHLRLEELLKRLPDDMPAEELGQHLSPLFAQSPKQQEAFYELFANSLNRSNRFFAQLESTTTVDYQTADTQNRWKWLISLLGLAFVIPPIFFFVLWLYTPQYNDQIIKPFEVNGGSSKIECLSDTLDLKGKAKIDKATLVFQKDISLGSVRIDTPYCITYIADSLSGYDSLVVELQLADQSTVQAIFLPQIIGVNEEVDVPFVDSRTPEEDEAEQVTITFKEKIRPYDHDLLTYHIPGAPWWKKFLAKHFWWLKWLGLLIFTALLYVIFLYRASMRKQVVADIDKKDNPPYAYHIYLPGVENINLGSAFGYMLNRLRQRTGSEAIKLDIPRTIDATINNAGMADFKFKRQTRPPEYLLLIDQQSKRNHRARLFDYIFRSFKANEVLIERYYYDGDPRLCYNSQHKNGIPLQSLQQQYNGARLLVLGNGQSFLDRFTGKAVAWCHLLDAWKVKALFTPKAINKWGKSERRLGQLFTVLPASLQGLSFWLEQLENEEDAEFDNWQNYILDAPQQAIQLDGPLIPSLQQHFSPLILKWIAACAIYPSLHWDLTLHLGQELSTEEHSLLRVEHILSICRLPWFIEGNIPDHSRLQLVEWLEKESPNELAMLRKEIVVILESAPPPENSSAFEDYRMNLALNDWLTTTDQSKKKELQQEIATLTDVGGDIDITVIKALKTEKQALDFILPEEWKNKIYPLGLSGLGWRGEWSDIMRWGISLWLPALVLAVWPWSFEIPSCTDGVAIDYVLNDGSSDNTYSLCVNDAMGIYYLQEKLLMMKINGDSLFKEQDLDAALNDASWKTMNIPAIVGNSNEQILWRHASGAMALDGGQLDKALLGYTFTSNDIGEDSLLTFLPEYRSNIAVELFNKGVAYSRIYQSDVLDTAAITAACRYFDMAIRADSTLFSTDDLENISNWCNQMDAEDNNCFVIADGISTILLSKTPKLEAEVSENINQELIQQIKTSEEKLYKLQKQSKILQQTVKKTSDPEKKAYENARLNVLKKETNVLEREIDKLNQSENRTSSDYLNSGDQVTLLEEGEDYYKISTATLQGYIPKSYSRRTTLSPCPSQKAITLTGRALDMSGGKALNDVSYNAGSINGGATDRSGKFTIDIPEGYNDNFITIAFKKTGYAPLKITFGINEKLPDVYLFSEKLARGKVSTFSGTVTDSKTQNAVPSALIQIESRNFQLMTMTEPDGRFELDYPVNQFTKNITISVVHGDTKWAQEVNSMPSASMNIKLESSKPVSPPPTRPSSTTKKVSGSKGKYIWLLDNAHGKETVGKRSPIFDDGKTQLFEYKLTRDIVSRMTKRLDGLAIEYYVVVPEETDISQAERAKRMNAYESPLPKLGISVHFNSMPTSRQNSWGDEAGQGIEAWYELGDDESKKLGAVFLSNALKSTSLKSRYLKSNSSNSFPIQYSTSMPVVLLEGGYMNIRSDAKKLNDPKFRQKLADAYVQAILDIEAYGLDKTPAPILNERDSDSDGIPNDEDACPFLSGEGTAEGCVKNTISIPEEVIKDKMSQTAKSLNIPVPDMVYVAGGNFTMGCVRGRDVEGKSQCPDAELPARQEKVDNFYIGKYEVTFTEYAAYANATKRSVPDDNKWGKDSRPVMNVSWYDAIQYCNWLSQKHGYKLAYTIINNQVTFNKNTNGFRLPTEVEWEYAARGGSKGTKEEKMYSGSNYQVEVAWYKMNSDYKTHAVGQKDANQLGIYDMSGNVAEWSNDRFNDFSQVKTYNDSGEVAVYRGGSWSTDYCRIAARDPWKPNNFGRAVGFRVVRSN